MMFQPDLVDRSASVPAATRSRKGKLGYLSGLSAEEIVARKLAERGLRVCHRRWRGKAGEIDLICRDGEAVIFVEIKCAASFERAALRLNRRQMDRIYRAGGEFLAGEPKGQLTETRFDVAVVNAFGDTQFIENAFWDA